MTVTQAGPEHAAGAHGDFFEGFEFEAVTATLTPVSIITARA